jgi:hypothetical protein
MAADHDGGEADMVDDPAELSESELPESEVDLPDTVAVGLQAQIDDLTATVEHHQRLFETLRAQGLLSAKPDDGRV